MAVGQPVMVRGGLHLPKPSVWAGIAGLALALAVLLSYRTQGNMAVLWLFGLLFGFVLQRSRFCFASSFRDLFLFKNGRAMKAVLLGMAIATPGFALAMFNMGPNIISGLYPFDANVLPLGWHTVFAGVIFALGMILAGGCLSGSLYRVGEGYVGSMVALVGVLVGMLLLGYTWNFWWEASVSFSKRIWFPHTFGWMGSIFLTLGLILLAYLAVLWWESRAGAHPQWQEPQEPPPVSFGQRLRSGLSTVFVRGWPVIAGGVLLGVLNAFQFSFDHPWGVTAEMYRWGDWITGRFDANPGVLKGLGDVGGACNIGGEVQPSGLTMGFMTNIGMVLGSFIAASFAGEFKLRFPRQPRRYVQSLGGGVLMGYGAALALGCTLGAFFSAVPSLALNAWVFAIGLLIGSFFGVKLLRRLG